MLQVAPSTCVTHRQHCCTHVATLVRNLIPSRDKSCFQSHGPSSPFRLTMETSRTPLVIMIVPSPSVHHFPTLPRSFVHRRLMNLASLSLSWRYYDNGPRDASPVLCFGGVAATAEAFYKQLLALAARGYRVVAVDPPPCATHAEWIRALDLFLDALKIYKARVRIIFRMYCMHLWLLRV